MIMEISLNTESETEDLIDLKNQYSAPKRRKVDEKTVVTVKSEANGVKQRNEGPPSDFWSWRKYGQKIIKGSPYPRGYYKCSTSKGCSAKKQVERCKTDASLLLITYTSTHNHPGGPDLLNTTKLTPDKPIKPETKSIVQPPTSPNQKQQEEQEEEEPPPPQSSYLASDEEPYEDHFHYLKSSSKDIINNREDDPFTVDQLDNTHELLGFVFVEEPISYPQIMNLSTLTKPEESDFFDELEELPTSSSLASFMRPCPC